MMIQLPPDFSLSLLFSDLFTVSTPLVTLAFLIGSGFLLTKMLSRVRF